MGKGFDYLKEPRSRFAVREGERRIRRSDPLGTAGGSLRVGWSPKEKWQITKILREDFLSRGPLSV
jgi:hypothetical protein